MLLHFLPASRYRVLNPARVFHKKTEEEPCCGKKHDRLEGNGYPEVIGNKAEYRNTDTAGAYGKADHKAGGNPEVLREYPLCHDHGDGKGRDEHHAECPEHQGEHDALGNKDKGKDQGRKEHREDKIPLMAPSVCKRGTEYRPNHPA